MSELDLRLAKTRLNFDSSASADAPVLGTYGMAYRGKTQKLELGGLTVLNPDILFSPYPECYTPNIKGTSESDGVEKPDCGLTPLSIGGNVMKKLRIYVETKEQKIYISSAGATKP